MAGNPNYTETEEGFVKNDRSQVKGASIDWTRVEREEKWRQEIREEREERNREHNEKRKDS